MALSCRTGVSFREWATGDPRVLATAIELIGEEDEQARRVGGKGSDEGPMSG